MSFENHNAEFEIEGSSPLKENIHTEQRSLADKEYSADIDVRSNFLFIL